MTKRLRLAATVHRRSRLASRRSVRRRAASPPRTTSRSSRSCDPRFSPDGSTIAFVVTTVDQKQNRRRSALWSVPADGSREAGRADDGAAVVEQPALEPGRQGDRVPVGAPGGGRRSDGHAAHAGVAAAARRRRTAPRDQPAERRHQLPVVARRQPARRRQPQRAERHGEVAERRAALQARQLQVQRQRLVRRQARAPLGRRRRVGPRDADHLRRRLERHAIRSGRPTAARSRSCPTGPARRSTRATTPTSG